MMKIDPTDSLRTTNADSDFRPITQTHQEILSVCNEIANLLIEKNKSYGDSALDPIRIFSQSDNIEQLKVRIDDKLSRFVRGNEYSGDNNLDDLIGYLVLLKVAKRDNWR
jgi:hypothetical protein